MQFYGDALTMYCVVMSCRVVSCLIMSCRVLPCRVHGLVLGVVFWCLVFFCLLLSCLLLSCLVLAWLGLACPCLAFDLIWFGFNCQAGAHDGCLVEWTDISQYEKVMAVNFIGVVRMSKAVLGLLKESGGRLVNVASMDGLRPMPGISSKTTHLRSCPPYPLSCLCLALPCLVLPCLVLSLSCPCLVLAIYFMVLSCLVFALYWIGWTYCSRSTLGNRIGISLLTCIYFNQDI